MGPNFVHIKFDKIWKFLLQIKAVEYYGKMVKLTFMYRIQASQWFIH